MIWCMELKHPNSLLHRNRQGYPQLPRHMNGPAGCSLPLQICQRCYIDKQNRLKGWFFEYSDRFTNQPILDYFRVSYSAITVLLFPVGLVRVLRFLFCSFRNLIKALNSFRSSSVQGLSKTVKSIFLGSLISPMILFFKILIN